MNYDVELRVLYGELAEKDPGTKEAHDISMKIVTLAKKRIENRRREFQALESWK